MSLPVILGIFLLILLWVVLARSDRLARFWSFPSKQKTNKYPTIEDIRRKYPKKLSQEQLRRQAMAKDDIEAKRKQEIIDRNIREIRSAQEKPSMRESKLEQSMRLDILHQQFRDKPTTASRKSTTSSPKKPDISIAKLRKLTKMVNGQEAIARRLIEGNLKLFPDKSPDWACEKAISDIERDRQ